VSKQLGWPLISANSLAGLLQGFWTAWLSKEKSWQTARLATYQCKQSGQSTARTSSVQLGCLKRKVCKQLSWPLISANSSAGPLQGTLLNSLAPGWEKCANSYAGTS
jgi:hypothetical protein